jgi:hypothetical protein
MARKRSKVKKGPEKTLSFHFRLIPGTDTTQPQTNKQNKDIMMSNPELPHYKIQLSNFQWKHHKEYQETPEGQKTLTESVSEESHMSDFVDKH